MDDETLFLFNQGLHMGIIVRVYNISSVINKRWVVFQDKRLFLDGTSVDSHATVYLRSDGNCVDDPAAATTKACKPKKQEA